ncbi:MAG: hypothetical protein ACREJ2_06320 [Planctomycetota bacterium]
MSDASPEAAIDPVTVERWAAPYLGWQYHPDHCIPSDPGIVGFPHARNPDAPCIFQLPGETDRWRISFIAFDGQGYNSFIAESRDLVHWTAPRLALGFGPPGSFDFGGSVLGAFLYESWAVRAPRRLRRRAGRFWSLYGAYAHQGGYEIDPGYEGLASSADGLTWERAQPDPVLSIHDPDCAAWENDCIYQPWLLEHEGRFLNFYNAKRMPEWIEQTGLAFSDDLRHWTRHPANPVLPVRPGGWDEKFASDPKVYRDADHWTMFYFGLNGAGAHIMIAFSRDLRHWTARTEPLYAAGGHPGGLDAQYAHKTSLVFDPADGAGYLFYCACGKNGRGIGLITNRRR